MTCNIVLEGQIFVPAGTCVMDCEGALHDAFCKKMTHHDVSSVGFCITPLVTQKRWEDTMNTKPWKPIEITAGAGAVGLIGDDLPAKYVSWNDVQAFIVKLNEQTDKTYRLPTESEWEYAFHRSDDLGIKDMDGRIWEWVADECDRTPYVPFNDDEQSNPSEPYHICRGGCRDDLIPLTLNPEAHLRGECVPYCCNAAHFGHHSSYVSENLGFRLAYSPTLEEIRALESIAKNV